MDDDSHQLGSESDEGDGLPAAASDANDAQPGKKRRGRPRGSRNKEKDLESVAKWLLGPPASTSKRLLKLEDHERTRLRLLTLHAKLTAFVNETSALVEKENLAINHLRADALAVSSIANSQRSGSSRAAAAPSAAAAVPGAAPLFSGDQRLAPASSTPTASAVTSSASQHSAVQPPSVLAGISSSQLLQAYNGAALAQAAALTLAQAAATHGSAGAHASSLPPGASQPPMAPQ